MLGILFKYASYHQSFQTFDFLSDLNLGLQVVYLCLSSKVQVKIADWDKYLNDFRVNIFQTSNV